MITLNDYEILETIGGLANNSLLNIINTENYTTEIKETNFKQSPYTDVEQFIQIAKVGNNKFSTISLNCQSMNAKFEEIVSFISTLNTNGAAIDVICIQETWISEKWIYLYFTLMDII